MEKAFEELQIKDDFVFSVIMRNPRFCKLFFNRQQQFTPKFFQVHHAIQSV